MKRMKKLAGLLLAMVMVLSMAITAFADEGSIATGEKGTITINDAVAGQTYTIYKIFDLESFDTEIGTGGAYAYKISESWRTFCTTGAGKDYVSIDSQDYVTWEKKNAAGENIGASDFAAAALEYAKDKNNNITAAASQKADSNTVTFDNLDLGYYLLDSTLGALCSLDTTNLNAIIEEKNEEPTVEKSVEEDSKVESKAENVWGEKNDANIGQIVNYKTTIHAKKGAENYVLHDKMTEGLTFDPKSVVVKVGDTALAIGTDYELITKNLPADCFDDEDSVEEDCDFHIVFKEAYLKNITSDTDIVITYSATLNKDAVIADGTNDNDTRLVYGDENKTEWITTKTKTYEFDLVKTDKDTAKVITGATFKLYDAKTDGNEIPVVKVENGVYRVAVSGETGVVIEAGSPTIKGLDGGTTYYLEEITAPKGFNKLAARFEFTIESANKKATIVENVHQGGGVEVANQKGALLPETGGMGTTIFYILGAILVIGAAVLLIT